VLFSLDLSGITAAIGTGTMFYTPTLKNGVLLRNIANDISLCRYFHSVPFRRLCRFFWKGIKGKDRNGIGI
jgi:hypothetical protein